MTNLHSARASRLRVGRGCGEDWTGMDNDYNWPWAHAIGPKDGPVSVTQQIHHSHAITVA